MSTDLTPGVAGTAPVVAAAAAREELVRARELVAPGLLAAADRLGPRLRRVVGFHFGWWDAKGQPYGGAGMACAGGKAVRPALAELCAQAVGGEPGRGVPAAVAVELVHNFSLLHDDVMDSDRTRRHRPTAWAVFGVPAAILAGDTLLALAADVLATGYPELAGEASRLVTGAVLGLLDGQAADVAFEHRADVSLAECLEMVAGKTGALLACACELGALAGGASPARAARMRRFGEHLGLAFQLVDDLLGIWGDPAVTGKPVMNDLRTRKKSLPVVAALSSGTDAGRRLGRLYTGRRPLSDRDLRTAAELVERSGGRAWARERTEAALDAALACLHAAAPEPAAAARLAAIARLVGDRDR
jgi:geranylgeranyl diphosphate synthase type I